VFQGESYLILALAYVILSVMLIFSIYCRNVVVAYFAMYEVELVRQRKARRLQRRQFWAAGVNDLFAVDQHDKWLRFGLALHTGIEPFSGRIMWMRVWHSNRNPQLILTYYLETIQELGRKFDLFLLVRL
jgi:hypothetical protein